MAFAIKTFIVIYIKIPISFFYRKRKEKERKAKEEGKKFSTENKPTNQISETYKENISKKTGTKINNQEVKSGASLVAQWLRICLLMQGTRVRALVWEDPTCHGAAGPVSHNC